MRGNIKIPAHRADSQLPLQPNHLLKIWLSVQTQCLHLQEIIIDLISIGWSNVEFEGRVIGEEVKCDGGGYE